jgi:7,8-dihydropterin-6-yl-methyl-4-(beta-D-ribofuranosyl)aminobenzene 5'-phosphate synthase
MNVRLTVLCENSVGRPNGTIGEHGFACLVETTSGTLLFDTGTGAGILHNAQVLGRNLALVRTIVLSHGHCDHTGGLLDVLSRTGPVDVIAHPGIFAERYWAGEHERRAIGIPFVRERLESLGARFQLRRQYGEVVPGVYFSGEIPRVTPFETGDPHLIAAGSDGVLVPDTFPDDAALVIETGRGLVLLVGCAHAGLVNTLQTVREQTGCTRLYAVLGGTHLAPVSDEQFSGTVRALRAFGVERIGVSHCTGLPRAAQLLAEFGGRFFFATVGSTLEL